CGISSGRYVRGQEAVRGESTRSGHQRRSEPVILRVRNRAERANHARPRCRPQDGLRLRGDGQRGRGPGGRPGSPRPRDRRSSAHGRGSQATQVPRWRGGWWGWRRRFRWWGFWWWWRFWRQVVDRSAEDMDRDAAELAELEAAQARPTET